MNINLLSLSNNKKSSYICVKYGSKDVYTAGKSANCDLTPNWAQFISVAGQRLYAIQRRRPISAKMGHNRQTDRYFIARKKVNPDLFVIEIREIYVHVYTRLLICYIKII